MKFNMFFAKDLPVAIKAYVQKRFPTLSIAFAEKNVTSIGIGYLVSLNDGTEMVFSPTGQCTSIHHLYENDNPILI